MKKIFPVILSLALLLPYYHTSALASYNQAGAINYLKSHPNNSWVVMGLSALGESSSQADFLKTISTTSAIDLEAPILALTSLNLNPRTFGSIDLVSKLKTFQTQNQLGDPSTVNDDIFGILALISAGEDSTDSVIQNSKSFILGNQNSDGSWGFAISGSGDTNMTSGAILALKAAGAQNSDTQIQNALNYLKSAQNSDGGFTYDPKSSFGTASDSSSTAWVLWALNSLGINDEAWTREDNSPSEYLSKTQTQAGYFEYQSGAGENSFSAVNTAYSVIALSGKYLPLKKFTAQASETFAFRIEGSNETICEGKTAGLTALDIIKNTSAQCGFLYTIKDTSFGPYLQKINQDEASGTIGWQYMVNWQSPSIGAADYSLKTGDEILWYFNNFDAKPLKLSLSPLEINTGQSTQAFVTDYTGQAVSAAEVKAGLDSFLTNGDGQVSITTADGYFQVFSQKTGFVRSNKILLKIGSPASGQINLSANISGQVEGTSTNPSILSFTIDPSALDFGNLKKGQSSQKEMTVNNTGTVDINLQAVVSGDDLFTENLALNQSLWKNFSLGLNKQTSSLFTAKLTAPPTYLGSGPKQGKLVIWAAPK